ncbi:MAG: hypothetical protein OXU20_16260 [Myxococcales bacterium]|nr:hypothetical protein [Myxococcales bacterium]
MKVFRYSKWDGTQEAFSLDADQALDALGDLMMHGLSPRDAMDHMRQYGFDLAGQDFRVMGTQELMDELRKAARDLLDRYNMDQATQSQEQLFERMADLEAEALKREHGYESRAMNDFLERRHSDAERLSERIEKFDGYQFQDEEAAEIYEALKGELERMKQLEDFLKQAGRHFQGPEAADYDRAQEIREQFEALQQTMQALQRGELDKIDPQMMRQWAGEQGGRSLIILRDLEDRMREQGYLRTGENSDELTPRAMRRIGAHALASVYSSLRKARPGSHETQERGAGLPRPDESRPYRFGDALNIDVVKSVMNGLKRLSGDAISQDGLRLEVDDLEVREMDFSTQTTTVLLLDLSWSMSFQGRFPAAKRVALAMDQLIRTQFPRDHFFVVGFSTRARELRGPELLEIDWDPGDPFTNLQEGLMEAERLIVKHPSPSPQVLVITDGQPTAYFTDQGELHAEWPSSYGGISPRAVAQTLKQVQRITRRGITINTFMLHDSPELVGFVERMTEVNRGRALFTDPAHLGSYVMVDHLASRQKKRR